MISEVEDLSKPSSLLVNPHPIHEVVFLYHSENKKNCLMVVNTTTSRRENNKCLCELVCVLRRSVCKPTGMLLVFREEFVDVVYIILKYFELGARNRVNALRGERPLPVLAVSVGNYRRVF